jgi:hypothetical protein
VRVVLAYSGGLDTSVILAWLKEEYDADVITYTADVGQGEEVHEAVEKALATGAVAAVADDLIEEFVTDAVFPALRAAAVYEFDYLLGTSLARPIITKGLVETARRYEADAISHGATGKGNDQVRFELSTAALAPDLRTIAPWREWKMGGRSDLVAYAKARGIPVPVTKKAPYSIDANLFHTSFEGGILEDPWASPPSAMFRMTVNPEDAPDEPQEITIGFSSGIPDSVDGENTGSAESTSSRTDSSVSRTGGSTRRRAEPCSMRLARPSSPSPSTARFYVFVTTSRAATPRSHTTAFGTRRSERNSRRRWTRSSSLSAVRPVSFCTRDPCDSWEGDLQTRCTARTWPPSRQRMSSIRAMPRASSTSTP